MMPKKKKHCDKTTLCNELKSISLNQSVINYLHTHIYIRIYICIFLFIQIIGVFRMFIFENVNNKKKIKIKTDCGNRPSSQR